MQLLQSLKLLVSSLLVFKITLQISWLACPYRCCYLEWTLGLNLSQLQQKLQWAAPALWCWALSNLGQKNRTSWSFWCITKPFLFSFSCSWGIVFFLQRFITDAVIMHQKPYCILFFLEMISEKLLSLLCQVEYIYMNYTQKFIYSNSHLKSCKFSSKMSAFQKFSFSCQPSHHETWKHLTLIFWVPAQKALQCKATWLAAWFGLCITSRQNCGAEKAEGYCFPHLEGRFLWIWALGIQHGCLHLEEKMVVTAW